MSQISPPMRILFAGAVVFLAVWFTLLRPKSDAAPAVTATTTSTPAAGNVNTGEPAVTGAGKAVEKAKTAAAGAERAAKASAGETPAAGGTATTPGAAAKTTPGTATATTPAGKAEAPAVTVPAAQLAKLPKDVAGAVTGHKVLVLAVLSDDATRWRPMADDDRYVRNTLKKVNRYDGDVVVKQVGIGGLRTYGGVVNDLNVNQTPSVVIVDRKLKANVLEGYVDRLSINQAIADARRDSTDRLITDSYLRKANEVCANANVSISRWSLPTIPGKKARVASGKRLQVALRSYRGTVGRLAAPKQWRSLKRQWLAELAGEQRVIDKALTRAKVKDAAGWNSVIVTWDPTAARTLDHRFDDAGLTSCSLLRRA